MTKRFPNTDYGVRRYLWFEEELRLAHGPKKGRSKKGHRFTYQQALQLYREHVHRTKDPGRRIMDGMNCTRALAGAVQAEVIIRHEKGVYEWNA